MQGQSTFFCRMSPNPSRTSLATTRAEIHLERLRSNVAIIQSRMPGLDLMGVVKANAYGHGAVIVAKALLAKNIRHLGVATLPEALELREAGIESSIMVFAPIRADWVDAATRACLDVVIDGPESLEAAKRTTGRLRCHLKIDTGMGRLGRTPEESLTQLKEIESASNLDLGSIWTHFARADEPESDVTDMQLDRFESFIDGLGGAPAPLHVAASAAVFAHPRAVDAGRYAMARVGIALYGLLDMPGQERPAFGLQPVMECVSRITSLKRVSTDTPISYGGRWTAPRDTWIATVGAGYADGLSRQLSNKGRVRIGHQTFPIVGTICMDMFMVDLGPEPGNIGTGDDVTLLGHSSPTAFEVADHMDSIPYVPVCAISSRVPRLER